MCKFENKKTDENKQQWQQRDPWAPSVPYVNDLMQRLGTAGSQLGGARSPREMDAYSKLFAANGQPDQFSGDASQVARKMFDYESQAPTVRDAYKTLQTQLTPYARGDFLDFNTNPYIANILKTVREDASNATTGMFAGGGRDFSPGHAMALGKGITAAESPVLSNLFQSEQDKQIGAAGKLFGAGSETANVGQQLDLQALGVNAGGLGVAQQANQLRDEPALKTLGLEQKFKQAPFDELGWLAPYILGVAGLGGNTQGRGNTNTEQNTFGGDTTDILKKFLFGTG